jgi:hypothetical protein
VATESASSSLTLLQADKNKTSNANGNTFTNLNMDTFPKRGHKLAARQHQGELHIEVHQPN